MSFVAPRRVVIARERWNRLLHELAVRGDGRRESGAFLLGSVEDGTVSVLDEVYYDELDADCLTGGISFAGWAYGSLWRICEERQLTVVADIHTHPGWGIGQSETDRTHPMISMAGHVALIAPNFARGDIESRDVGVHFYLGNGRWESHRGDAATSRLDIFDAKTKGWWRRWRSLLPGFIRP